MPAPFTAAFLNQYLSPRRASRSDPAMRSFASSRSSTCRRSFNMPLFVFRPLLTRMALRWTEGKRTELPSCAEARQ